MNRTIRWRSCCFYYENELEKKRHVNVSSWQANFILVQDLQKPFEDLSFGLSLHTYYSTYYYYISKRWHSYFYRVLNSNREHMVKSFPLSVIENYKYAFRQNKITTPGRRGWILKANPPVNQQTCCNSSSNL